MNEHQPFSPMDAVDTANSADCFVRSLRIPACTEKYERPQNLETEITDNLFLEAFYSEMFQVEPTGNIRKEARNMIGNFYFWKDVLIESYENDGVDPYIIEVLRLLPLCSATNFAHEKIEKFEYEKIVNPERCEELNEQINRWALRAIIAEKAEDMEQDMPQ